MATVSKYFALRFRQGDALHKRGDIQNCTSRAIHIGQTPECEIKLPPHPDYADSCYAVIVWRENGWYIIRQEHDANITVNGIELDLIAALNDCDKVAFDNTLVEFSTFEGKPEATYVHKSTSYWLWGLMTIVILALIGITYYVFSSNIDIESTFKNEVADIYKVQADSLIIFKDGVPIDTIDLERKHVGTGFVTDDGYFVTARHCVEFWLAEEDELRTDYSEISSKEVRYAIDAESDTSITLVSKISIISKDNKLIISLNSTDFTIDKSNDLLYEYGTINKPYVWRSVVSQYENRHAELGDVAVMKWDKRGSIHIDYGLTKMRRHSMLYGFGYAQSEKTGDELQCQNGRLFYKPRDKNDCFTCDEAFYKGLSGGPVFRIRWSMMQPSGVVVGITSRMASKETLFVPATQIHKLIDEISQDEQQK